MNKWQTMVQSFHRRVVGGGTSPARPAIRDAELRARLILEEALETAAGLVGDLRMFELTEEALHKAESAPGPANDPDLVEVVDGLCDLLYVLLGTAEAVGVDLESYFQLVHDANMKKTNGETDVPGKRGAKPPGWEDPKKKIGEALERQTAEHDSIDDMVGSLNAVAGRRQS